MGPTPDVRARELVDEFFEKQDEPQYMRNVLSGLSGIMLVFTAAFFICALVVASIDNAGFDVVLTGLLLCVWEVGAMWLLKRGPHDTSLGFLIGVTLVLNVITLMTAIYWGQLAGCDSDYDGDYGQYSCSNKSAMRGVAAFASIIWVLQLPFIYLLVQRRGVLTREDYATSGGRYADYDDPAFAPGERDSGGWGKAPVDDGSPRVGAVAGSSSGTPETTDL
ncbi:unnamed protein product [Ectocarpus sp. 6 AP-2014]